MGTVSGADIAAGIEDQIARLADNAQVNKDIVRLVIDVVAEHLDANGPLPSDSEASQQRFTELLPGILADKRLKGLSFKAPPPKPGSLGLPPVIPAVVLTAELAVVGYAIYRELHEE